MSGYVIYRCLTCNGMNKDCRRDDFRCGCSWTCGNEVAATLPAVTKRERYIPDVLGCPYRACHGFVVPWTVEESGMSPIVPLWEFYHPSRAEIRRAKGKAEMDYLKAGGLMIRQHPEASEAFKPVADKLRMMAHEAGQDPGEMIGKIKEAAQFIP